MNSSHLWHYPYVGFLSMLLLSGCTDEKKSTISPKYAVPGYTVREGMAGILTVNGTNAKYEILEI